jgi:anion-transporting  ArsA/GET3 family ATPase
VTLPLGDRELLVVTGKGGVGKSSVAAALGVVSAADRSALVLEVDPRENVHQMFSTPPSGGQIIPVEPGLWLQNLRPRQVVDRLVTDRVKIEAIVRRVLSSPVYQQFAEGAPGLKELAILGHALEIVRGRVRDAPPVEQIVLDAPATGHGLTLLRAPRLVADAIGRGPVAELTREVCEWVERDGATGVVVVTLAEEMPVTEALELIETLDRELDREPDVVIVNQLYPPLPPGFAPRDELGKLWRKRRELNDEELSRLRAAWDGPTVELPLLPLARGPELVAALAARIGSDLAEQAP